MTPIWGAFKDFVIESDKDFKRYDLASDEIYAEDDIDGYFDCQYESVFDAYNGDVDSVCGPSDSYFDMMAGSNRIFDYDIDMGQYEGTFDAQILKEILRKLTSDPRFSHFSVQAMNDYSRIDYESDFEDTESTNFVDYYDFDNNNFIDYEEDL
ncbi:hypothetical protein DOY81_010998 [Sarcophaga bullata]|nr:hypothetical protein DOY81_010998 [Sarcophaga bullata]